MTTRMLTDAKMEESRDIHVINQILSVMVCTMHDDKTSN